MEKLFRTEFIEGFIRTKGMTKAQFCASAKIDLSDLEKVLNKDYSVSVETLRRIAKKLNLNVALLFHIKEKDVKYL